MTSTENTATAYEITYTKASGRYYVSLDGIRVGWVTKGTDYDRGRRGVTEWSFVATTRTALEGERLSTEPQRGVAVEEGLSNLSIYHLGRVFRLDMDRDSDTYMKDVTVYFDRDRLSATIDHMSSVRYGLV